MGQMESESRSSRLSLWVIVLLSMVVVTAGVLSARGNALPPVLYLVMGLVAVPLIAIAVARVRPRRAKTVQICVVLLSGALAYLLAYSSSRVDPAVGFARMFGMPPPASVSELTVRQQWFDGVTRLATFRINDRDFQLLLGRGSLEPMHPHGATPEEHKHAWDQLRNPFTTVARIDWPAQNPATGGVFYEYVQRGSSGSTGPFTFEVLRDPASGRVWAVYAPF